MIDTEDIIGTPWEEGGREPQKGLDCLGVVLLGLRRMGLPAFDPWAAWSRAWRAGWRSIEEAIPEGWRRVQQGEGLQAGDVLITMEMGSPSHIALLVDGMHVLTSVDGHGVVLWPLRWARQHLHSAWRAE